MEKSQKQIQVIDKKNNDNLKQTQTNKDSSNVTHHQHSTKAPQNKCQSHHPKDQKTSTAKKIQQIKSNPKNENLQTKQKQQSSDQKNNLKEGSLGQKVQKPQENQNTTSDTPQNKISESTDQKVSKNEQKIKQQTHELKSFEINFDEFNFTFQLQNNLFTVIGQKQHVRNVFKQTFTFETFTQQMKALFESTADIWNVFNSAKQNLIFTESKLFFVIKLGEKEKRINIPLKQKNLTDPEYIEKLQKISQKYKEQVKVLEEQLKQIKANCKCIDKIQLDKISSEAIDQKNDINIVSARSKASSIWPDFPQNYQDQEDDPLVLFDELISKLNRMREQFDGLVREIQQKIQSKGGIKMIKVKFLVLQKKKKDFLGQLEKQRQKFTGFQCRVQIQREIDELREFIEQNYNRIDNRISLMDIEK